MSEEKKQPNDGLEITYQIPIERFKYTDELEQINAKLKKSNRSLKIMTVALVILMFLIGWLFGSIYKLPFVHTVEESISAITTEDSTAKVETVLNLMETQWYFGKSIDNLEERLTDQALTGITTNEEDPHTEYMSKEEIETFTQSINRNFVGIGIQYQSTEDGMNIVLKVFRDSPAEKAGMQAGDVIYSVDGTRVEGLTAAEIKELVQGEEGTEVTVTVLRDGELIPLEITRGEIAHTVDSTVLDDNIGCIVIDQFGNSTAQEVEYELQDFESRGVTKLIIDVREDGGGYLTALKGVVDLLLPKNTAFLVQEYNDGIAETSKTDGGQYTSFGPIVILVDENTASAAEAFTLALSEQRDDVTVIGKTTYGKGTVQITDYFDDGSALKYTHSIWKSPNGVWINDTGITPDIEVDLHPALSIEYEEMGEDEVREADTVSDYTKFAQLCLDYLGYDVKRTDGYMDESTLAALKQFESDYELEETDHLNSTVYTALISKVIYDWNTTTEHDTQLRKALEVLSGSEETASAETAEEAVQTAETAETETGAVMFEAIERNTLKTKTVTVNG